MPAVQSRQYAPVPRCDPAWGLLRGLIAGPHARLAGVRILLAWRYDWKPKRGYLQLGKCVRPKQIDRELHHDWEFVILLNAEEWPGCNQVALLDHELCHAGIDPAKQGEARYYVIRHPVEEFPEVVARHGLWSADLRALDAAAGEHRCLSNTLPVAPGAGPGQRAAEQPTATAVRPWRPRRLERMPELGGGAR